MNDSLLRNCFCQDWLLYRVCEFIFSYILLTYYAFTFISAFTVLATHAFKTLFYIELKGSSDPCKISSLHGTHYGEITIITCVRNMYERILDVDIY